MPYDVAFRHAQALDPSALTTMIATIHAIESAMTDCRNAGVNADTDPAVALLARHLAAIGSSLGDDARLRRRCMDSIAELRRHPALLSLAYRGVAHDEAAKALFHSDGRRAMKRLASALGLRPSEYDLRSNKSHPASSGEITLHSERLYVQLSLGALGPDNEVMFRKVASRRDHLGERNHYAPLRDLLDPDRFAQTIRRALRLSEAARQPERLFA